MKYYLRRVVHSVYIINTKDKGLEIDLTEHEIDTIHNGWYQFNKGQNILEKEWDKEVPKGKNSG